VKRFIVLMISIWLLSGCSVQTNTSDEEIGKFISGYNDAVDIVEKNTEFEFKKLNKDNFSKLEKAPDGFGFNQKLINEKEEKSLYELKCIYGNNREIIGFLAYGIGDISKALESGSPSFPDTSLVIGQLTAKTLGLDILTLNNHFEKAINFDEEINEVFYEEQGYRITIHTDKKVGGISYKFMKTASEN
jgi:hypothetical protein